MKTMNPLKSKQYDLLRAMGNQDAADKINELVREFNKLEKPKRNSVDEFDSVANAIFEADTLYDAKEILFSYVKKLK